MQSVVHIGVKLSGAAVAGLDFIDHQENVLLPQEGFQFEGEHGIERNDAAFPLYTFNQYSRDLSACAERLQRIHVPGRDMRKAGSKGLIKLMVMLLAGGGQGRQGTAVEAVFQRYNDIAVRAFVFRSPLPGRLDCAFIGLGTGIPEKNAGEAGACAQHFSQPGAGSGVVQIGHMLHLTDLILHGGDPGLIGNAEGSDCNSRTHVDVFLSRSILHKGAFSGNDLHREPFIGMGDIRLIKFDGGHMILR